MKHKKSKIAKRIDKSRKRRALRIKKRPLYKQILLHPLLVFVILLFGVLLVEALLYKSSQADNLNISAIVPAVPLSQGANINSIASNSISRSSPINVSGSCPQDSYVELSRNSQLSGAANCNNGSFQIQTDLSPGTNTLQAEDYNTTDAPGPVSNSINVTYSPSTVTQTTATGLQITEASNSVEDQSVPPADNSGNGPLLIDSTYHYLNYKSDTINTWQVDLKGGTPPYFVNVKWGDGQSSELLFTSDPLFNIQHSYDKSGNYNIVVQSLDSRGYKAEFQITTHIVASAKQLPVPTGIGRQISDNYSYVRHSIDGQIWIVSVVYISIAIMIFSFWLGERREYQHLMKPARPRTK